MTAWASRVTSLTKYNQTILGQWSQPESLASLLTFSIRLLFLTRRHVVFEEMFPPAKVASQCWEHVTWNGSGGEACMLATSPLPVQPDMDRYEFCRNPTCFVFFFCLGFPQNPYQTPTKEKGLVLILRDSSPIFFCLFTWGPVQNPHQTLIWYWFWRKLYLLFMYFCCCFA